MIISDPTPLPHEVVEAAERWIDREKTKLFALITNGAHPHTNDLRRELVWKIREEQDKIDGTKTLDVILDSSGGDADAAYQIATFLQTCCKKVRVFIPDWAKSAATLFSLGADEIWMSKTAELGPLDAQIPDPRDPEKRISALEEFKAIHYLRQYAFEVLDNYVRILILRTRMRLRDIIPETTSFVTKLMEPLYSQIDPLYFGGAHRALDVSMEYGKRLMSTYSYKAWSTEQVDRLLEKLTWDYPSHSFVVNYNEAKNLNLKVNLLDGEKEEDAKLIVDKMQECVGLFIPETTASQKAKDKRDAKDETKRK